MIETIEEEMMVFPEKGDLRMGDLLIDSTDNTHWLVCANGEDVIAAYGKEIRPIKELQYSTHTRPSLLSLCVDIQGVQEHINILLKGLAVKGRTLACLPDWLDTLCANEKFLVDVICKRVMAEGLKND